MEYRTDGVNVVILDGVVALGTPALRALSDHRIFMSISLDEWRRRAAVFQEWKGRAPGEIATILDGRTLDEFGVIAAHAQWASAVVTQPGEAR